MFVIFNFGYQQFPDLIKKPIKNIIMLLYGRLNIKNERLRHLKYKKEIWYPTELLQSLIYKLEKYLAENAGSKAVGKSWETVNRLLISLKTEFDLLNSIGTEMRDDEITSSLSK